MNTMFQKRIIRSIQFLALVLFLGGCATAKTPYTGFLDNYKGMKESEVYKGLMVDKENMAKLKDYDKFLIAPVVIYLHENAKGAAVDPKQLNALTDDLHKKMVDGLSGNYTVVEEPSEGVLLIRTALTDVVPAKPILNLHWATSASGAGLGGASIEAEFVDAVTNERILAIADTRRGKKFFQPLKKGVKGTGEAFETYFEGWSKWGHTKDVFEQWVGMLVEQLNQAHGIVKE